MFKQDEYIVILEGGSLGDPENETFPNNFIYKQREEKEYLRPYLDNQLDTSNGRPGLDYDQKHCKWRYATEKEAKAYEEYTAPLNINKIIGIGDTVIVSSNECTNTDNSFNLGQGAEFKVEDYIDKGSETYIYFTGIPGIFNSKYFERKIE